MPGMATLSGTVTAPSVFTAAQVYLRNTDKQMTYMVYTQGGKFRATPLFPGQYEVSVLTKGLVSDTQKVALKAGVNPAVTLAMRAGVGREPVGTQASGDSEADTNLTAGVRAEGSYDELYPPGPGRDVLERTCMICHGENFLSARPGGRSVWESRIGHMMGAALATGPATSYAMGLLTYRSGDPVFSREDREALLEYMVQNFGPGAKPRRVRQTQELPIDEAQLGKAMYVGVLPAR